MILSYPNTLSLCANSGAGRSSAGSHDSSSTSISSASPRYPQLERLCADFGLQVVQRPVSDGGESIYRRSFILMNQPSEAEGGQALTPCLPRMADLEAYVSANMVDVLHRYFFDDEQGSADEGPEQLDLANGIE